MSEIIKEETVSRAVAKNTNYDSFVADTSADLEINRNDSTKHSKGSSYLDPKFVLSEELSESNAGHYEGTGRKNNIKDEVSEATEDESMAVEALWQLGGGGYNEKEDSQKEMNSESLEQEPVRYPVIQSAYTLIQCESCPLSFSSETESQLHHSICDGRVKKALTCNICSITFDTKLNYDNHVVCHEVARPYSCRSCGSLFKQKNALQNHVCHQMLRNLQCNICGIEFTRASSLTNHMKVHSYTPGRALIEIPITGDSGPMESGYSSNNWSSENQALPPLLPQLDMQSANYCNQNSSYMSSWNMSLGLPDSLTSEDLPDSMDIAQEMTVNTTYLNALNSQPSCFQSEFDELNGSEDSLSYDSQTHEEVKMSCAPLAQNDDTEESLDTTETPVKLEVLHYPIVNKKDNNIVTIQELGDNSPSKKRPHSCRFCGVSFTRAKALVSHERLHQDYMSDFFECNKCGDVFLDSLRQKHHVCGPNSSQKDKTNITKTSGKISTLPDDNQKASNLGKPLEPDKYLVEDDPEELSGANPNSLKQKQNKHACRHCSKRFTTKQKMFRHMWIHREKTFSCEICGETFSLQNELDTHRLSSHPSITPHGCPVCGKCFASRQGLWEHTRSHHEGAAPHSCSLCGKGFSSRQGFLIHTRTHTGERPYGCKYCWKAFRDGGTLRKHERIHTGERPHVCPLCWRAFNQKVVLREHVRWVHAAPAGSSGAPFPCPLCPQVLPNKEDLCAHIVKHSDIIASNDKPSTDDHQRSPPKLSVKKDLFTSNSKDINNEYTTASTSNIMTPGTQYKSPVEELSFTCDMCSDMFTSREQLLAHVRVHI